MKNQHGLLLLVSIGCDKNPEQESAFHSNQENNKISLDTLLT